MDRKFLEGLLGGSEQSREVIDTILQAHEKTVSEMALGHTLSRAIAKAGGRSEKAILALMDVQAIGQSDDPAAAAEAALQQLKQEQDYLFAPPGLLYAPGTGAGTHTAPEPQSLAGALKQKFGK